MRDQIQVSSVCVFIALIAQGLFAWGLVQTSGPAAVAGIVLLAYVLLAYFALVMLALFFHYWAWLFCNAALVGGILYAVLIVSRAGGRLPALVLAGLLLLVCLVGLWAQFRPASVAVLRRQAAEIA